MLRAQLSTESSQRGKPSLLLPVVQRKTSGSQREVSGGQPQRQATAAASTRGGFDVDQATSAAASGGHPLSPVLRAWFEPRFDWDFSKVRVHHDRAAASAAAGVQAKAYTLGSHIVFNADEYAPHTPDGKRLLAHELAHVVQQAGHAGGSARPARAAIQRQQDTDTRETCRKREPLYGYDNIRNLSRERLRAAGFVFCGPDSDMDRSLWERWVHPTRGVLHFQVRWRGEPQRPPPPPDDDRQTRCADPCTSTTDDEDACKACCEEKIPEDDASCRRTCDVACSLMLMPVSGVSTPGDPLEREADLMADRVLNMPGRMAPAAAPPRAAASGALQVMRDVPDAPAEPSVDLMRSYSFGPTGRRRMLKDDGFTVFPPAAPSDLVAVPRHGHDHWQRTEGAPGGLSEHSTYSKSPL